MLDRVQRPWLKRIINWGLGLAVLILVGLVFYLGMASERSGFYREVIDPNLKRITLPVINAFRSTPDNLPLLRITIGDSSYLELKAIRERALEAGVLNEGKDAYFPAAITHGNDTLQVELRLKGGLVDHLRTAKWSFRVKVNDNDSLLGMETFSLQHPNTRNFANEWLFHKALAYVGVPSLQYDFIEVELNDRSLGIYAIEEHFNQTLLRRLRLGSGPVMKFDDELRIDALEQLAARPMDSDTLYYESWLAAPVDAFHLKTAKKDPVRWARFERAVLMMEGFRRGKRTTSEVFDVASLARLFAIGDLLGAQHAHDWRNLRFIPDSLTGKLIPIGFDGNAGEPIRAIRALREQGPVQFQSGVTENFYEQLFSDKEFYTNYISILDSISAPGWWEKFIATTEPELKHVESVIRTEFPNAAIDPMVYEHDRTVILQTLYPNHPVQAHFLGLFNQRPRIEATNLQGLPVQVLAVVFDGDTTLLEPQLLLPRRRDRPLQFSAVPCNLRMDEYPMKMQLLCKVLGIDQWHDINIKPWRVQ